MKAFATAIIIFLTLHLMAASGFITWLYASDRLNLERIEQVIELFRPTIAHQRAEAEAEAEQIEAEQQAQREEARLEAVSEGVVSAAALVDHRRAAEVLAAERMDRIDNDIQRLREQMTARERSLAQQIEAFEAEVEAFEQAREAYLDRLDDEDFKRIIDLLQRQPPEQVKDLFLQYIEQGRMRQVVDYLRAMRPAAASDVLTRFRRPQEIEAAATLIQELERHGADFLHTHMDEAATR